MKQLRLYTFMLSLGLLLSLAYWGAQSWQRAQAAVAANYPLDPNTFMTLGNSPFASAGTYKINASKNNPVPILTKPDNSTITGEFFTSDGGEIAVFTFNSIDIPAGVTVVGERNANSRPIALLSKSTVNIAGVVDVSGGAGGGYNIYNNNGTVGGAAGPGGGGGGGGGGGFGNGGPSNPPGDGASGGVGFVNGAAGSNANANADGAGGRGGNVVANGGGGGGANQSGGGGGAYGGNGGTSNFGSNGGAGGTAYGNLTTQLQGGSGGGGSSGTSSAGEGGGGGGGAVEIGALTSITISGSVQANGGPSNGGFSGGGGGGGILLHSPVGVSFSGTGGLSAAGGNNDVFAGGGGGGRIHIIAPILDVGTINVAGGTGTASGTAGIFTKTCSGPNRLIFVQQPTQTTPNTALNPAITVKVVTSCGEVVTNGPTVTLSLNNANGATLSGNSAVADANGIATFSNLRVSKAGTGYTLTADSPSVTSATSAAFNIICPTITVNPTSPVVLGGFVALTSGTIGVSYSQTFTQTGGVTPVQFSRPEGILPSGVTLSGNVLSGVPTSTGTYEFTIQVTDNNGCIGSQRYQLVVNCPPAFTLNTPAASATVGMNYNSSVTASPALPQGFSYRYRVIGLTPLPDGLTLDQDTGIIAGQPTTNGSFPFTISVDINFGVNSIGCAQTANYTISVGCTSNPIVTNLDDAGAGSLREAIALACAGSTITFQNGLAGTIPLATSQLVISRNLTIQGPAANAITLSGGQARRVLRVESGATVKLERLTITNGLAADNGGGISNSGNLTLQHCTVSGNTATGGSSFNYGGGIYNNGTLAIINSTLSGNTSSGGSSVNQGGGLYNDSTAICTITNSTIAGNTVVQGIGVLNVGGGIFNNSGGQVKVRNSILAKNTAPGAPDGRGTFTSLGNNLVGISASGFSSITNDQTGTSGSPLDPKLELDGNSNPKLASNGGPTQTIRLLPGSPAINGGANCVLDNSCASDALGFNLTTDQRGTGFARGVGPIDIGAYEVQAGIPNQLAFSVQPANTNAGTAFSVTVQVLDVLNTIVSSSTAAISLAFGNNPTAATLGGTTSGAAVAGQAVFSGLSINLPGTGYTLVASSGELVSATSTAFDVSFACPAINLNPTTLPGGIVGANYSQTFTQTGGSGAISYSQTAGTLPTGLTLLAGVLSGKPTQTGTFTFTVTATDNNNCMGSRAYHVQVNCPVNPLTRLYVKALVAPGGDGSSWASALPTLSQALALANAPCNAVSEIWVARGTYKPDTTGLANPRAATFTLRNGLAIYGGFTGGETLLTQRDPDPTSNGTVLSGDLSGDDGANFLNYIENSYNVVRGGGTDNTARLDGFTIRGGNANGSTINNGNNGNKGGGMYNENSSPTLANLDVHDNVASLGGGMFNLQSQPTLSKVNFSRNQASFGGGMQCNSSSPTLMYVSFSNNSAISGGGMHNDSNSNPTLTNVSFSGNAATGRGGGLYNFSNSSPTLTQVSFSGNSAANGGGLFNDGSRPTLTNTTFSGNSATSSGGGLYNYNSSPTLTNVSFSGNSATQGGVGIHNFETANPILRNCILWGDNGPEIVNLVGLTNSTPTISHSLVQGSGGSGANWNGSLGNDDGGNLDGDPLFVTSVPAPAPSTGGNLRLRVGSPAINRGNNSVTNPALPGTDLAGNPRVAGGTVDMGAYESNYALAVISGTPQSATVNLGFANALQVRLTEYNQPLSGVPLSFSAPGSGASAALSNGGLATTDAQGNASVTATANSAAGAYQVTASASATGPSASFSLTNLCAVPVVSNVQPSQPTCFGATNGSLTVQASGIAPLQYSRNNGQSFQTSNVFTGVAAGSYQIVVKDANGCLSASVPVTLLQPQALSFTTTQNNPTCNGATNGSLTINASGGTSALQYSINNGASFQQSNVFAGLAAGVYPIVVKDANGCPTLPQNVTLSQPAALSLAPSALPTSVVGQPFTQQFTPNGGTGAKSVSLQGALPNWLNFTPANATLSGTAPQPATVSFTLVVTDQANCTARFNYTLSFVCPIITLTPTALPSANLGAAYSATLSAAPTGTSYSYLVTTGVLPPGLSLHPTTGVLSGTPSSAGNYAFVITALGWTNGGSGCPQPQTYNLLVTATCPTVSLTPTSLASATVGTAYSQSLTASGVTGPFSFAVTAGTLPPGVSLTSSGSLSGTPTAAGSFSFTVTATGTGGCAGSQNYTLSSTCPALSLTPASLPNATAGNAYNQSLTVSPAGAANFSLATGNLPPGLSLTSAGSLSGTATATGTYNFTVKAERGNCSVTKAYTLIVSCPTVAVNPASLPNGSVGTAYSQTLNATPSGSYSFALSSGNLPAGLSLSTAGVLSGTPTASGTFTFIARATAFGSCAGTRSFTLTIAAACATITLPSLPSGTVGANYYGDLSATTPSGSYTFSVMNGPLPPGLALDNLFGALTGTPTAAGNYNFTLQAVSTNGCTGTQAYSVRIGSSGAAARAELADFDGDGLADPTVWRAATGEWESLLSGSGQTRTQRWGGTGDVPVLGDYDGDGQTDWATFRPSNGTWYIKRSSDSQALVKAWGLGTDLPVPGDYDGDGKTDIALWRGTTGTWYILRSTDGKAELVEWGSANTPYQDVPVTGDYDGDRRTDVAVFRRASGTWFIKHSRDGQMVTKRWGLGTDTPVAADYDGDGQTDLAVWRGSSWYIWLSATSSTRTVEWGSSVAPYYDQALPADYDGDGLADQAVWRPSERTWYLQCSRAGLRVNQASGPSGDRPVGSR